MRKQRRLGNCIHRHRRRGVLGDQLLTIYAVLSLKSNPAVTGAVDVTNVKRIGIRYGSRQSTKDVALGGKWAVTIFFGSNSIDDPVVSIYRR